VSPNRPDWGDPIEKDEWPEEPTEPTPEERARYAVQAAEDMTRLTRYAILLSVAAVLVGLAAAAAGIAGAETFARGLTIGCLVCIVNLRLLARGTWAMLAERDTLKAGLGFASSLGLLVAAAIVVGVRYPDQLFGFAIGLAVPAPAGVWFGLSLKNRAPPDGEGSGAEAP
jgi:hypothetical protein